MILLVLVLWLEPMTTGIHSPHIPPDTQLRAARLCLRAKKHSANGLLTLKIYTACTGDADERPTF